MKKITALFSLITAALILSGTLLFAGNNDPDHPVYSWNDEQFAAAFDEVARNFGAIEYASYTFMVEFGRHPESLQELRETGHLNVEMTNPYYESGVVDLTEEDIPDGHLAGNIFMRVESGGYIVFIEAYYVRSNGEYPTVHSMIKQITLYQSEIDHAYLFEQDIPRDEQFTAVYCRQAVDAIESFLQRKGRSPDDFIDMYDHGDVNVRYFNPVTGEMAVSSEEMSAGDFYYKKVGDETYTLIGWGREEPVFFATTDESEEIWFYETYFPEEVETGEE